MLKCLERLFLSLAASIAVAFPAFSDDTPAATPGVTTLYSFTNKAGDGAYPQAPLVLGSNGTLYGTTMLATGFSTGTVFKLVPPSSAGGAWTEVVLHLFNGVPGQPGDGAYPYGGLVLTSTGTLYGTTDSGGQSSNGTVFALTPPSGTGPWTESLLHSFTSTNGDGSGPLAGLVTGPNGVLYGTTSGGGSAHAGTVFQLTPPASQGAPWTETILYSFTGLNGDGKNPNAGVIIGAGGVLYGTTAYGGTSNYGAVFQLTPPASGTTWTEQILYSFAGYSDGEHPVAGLHLGPSGLLYGTTTTGGAGRQGTVFQLVPPSSLGGAWTESILHSFTGTNGDGADPCGNVVFNSAGVMFGTTAGGGKASFGTVFLLKPPASSGMPWTETILHNFTDQSPDGGNPRAGLVIAPSGVLYGTTSNGGASGYGAVFQVTP
jgi:uncharacterized repeat protein (TIGR03803 family)